MKVGSIESGVGIPPAARGLYPLARMQIGESFEVTAETPEEIKKLSNRIRQAVRAFSSRNPEYAFATRRIDTDRIRVWRVEGSPRRSSQGEARED